MELNTLQTETQVSNQSLAGAPLCVYSMKPTKKFADGTSVGPGLSPAATRPASFLPACGGATTPRLQRAPHGSSKPQRAQQQPGFCRSEAAPGEGE